MSIFDDTYRNAIECIITEGGNAIPNVDRIKKDYINKTVASFKKNIIEKYLGFDPKDSMFLTGSTGKKPDSGDIDIAIDINVFKDKNVLINLINLDEECAKQGYNSCINTFSYNMLHVAYPQVGNEKKLVQIDVLLTNHPEYVKFFMFSPAYKESKYKGAHRNALMKSILFTITYKPILKDDNGEPLKWEQYDLTHDGLFKQRKTLVDLNGNRLLYKSTDEELEFAYAKTEQEYFITDDPNVIIKNLFGEKYTEKDIESFEKIYDIILNDDDFKYKDLADNILKNAAKMLIESKERLDFPKELQPYLKDK